MKATGRTHLLALAVAAPLLAWTAAGARAAIDWPHVEAAAAGAGLSARAARQFAERCRERRMTAADAAVVLGPLDAGVREGLPMAPLLEKAQEGVSKGMAADVVAAAVERRRACLAEARSLAAERFASAAAGPDESVICALGLALESGLAVEAVSALLAHGSDKSARQLAWVAQAGEALVLSGFTADEVQALMLDYLARDLGRSETLRAVRYACERRREGARLDDVRRGLWGKGAGETYGNTYGPGPRPAAGRGDGRAQGAAGEGAGSSGRGAGDAERGESATSAERESGAGGGGVSAGGDAERSGSSSSAQSSGEAAGGDAGGGSGSGGAGTGDSGQDGSGVQGGTQGTSGSSGSGSTQSGRRSGR